MYEYKIVSLETFMEIPEIKAIKNKEKFKAGDSDLSRSNCVVDFMQMMFDYMGNQGWEYIGITRTNSTRIDTFATGKGLAFFKGVADGVFNKALGGGVSGIITNEGLIEAYFFKRRANIKVIFDGENNAGFECDSIVKQKEQLEIEKQQLDEEKKQTRLTEEQSKSEIIVENGFKISSGLVNSVPDSILIKSQSGLRSTAVIFSILVIISLVYYYNPNTITFSPNFSTEKSRKSGSKLPNCKGAEEATWNNCFGEIRYSTGDYYIGEYQSGKYHGKGTLEMSNGDQFTGDWKASFKDGYGVYTWKNGENIQGGWKNGLVHGNATYNYFDGRKFVGSHSNGKRLNGREFDKNGVVIKEWSAGVRTIVESNSKSPACSGSDEKSWTNCYGVQVNPNGSVYEGRWENGEYHGSGVFKYPNGDKYVGMFAQGNYNGIGTFTWVDGYEFSGNYKNDDRHGKGILFKNGLIVEDGMWENDKFIGPAN
jgi:hypothetical protein